MKKTASYKIEPSAEGDIFRFYCDVTGVQVCRTKAYRAETAEEELQQAWRLEGQHHFNQCHKCRRWVIDVAYNPEVMECVLCAPFEEEPQYCKFCGARITVPARICPVCGKLLRYEGEVNDK